MTAGQSRKFSNRNKVDVQVDHEICAGFADCVQTAPDVFALNDEGLAVVLDPDSVDLDVLRAAAEVCPVSAILLFDEGGKQIAPDLETPAG